MNDAIIVLNAGSSSLKFSLYHATHRPGRDNLLCHGQFTELGHDGGFSVRDRTGTALTQTRLGSLSHEAAIDHVLRWVRETFTDLRLIAAGHRVVHGGPRFVAPVRIDPQVMTQLRDLAPLAPLHQPHNLAAIDACAQRDPALPQVACFDTAFHHTQPWRATAFALPPDVADRGVRRYGFHGLSYEYIASQLPAALGESICDGRVIVAHMGNGV